MYHRKDDDFVAVDTELNNDFGRVCGVLQGFWTDIERESSQILENKKYVAKRNSGNTLEIYGSSKYSVTSSTTSFVAVMGTQGPVKKGS